MEPLKDFETTPGENLSFTIAQSGAIYVFQ